MMDLSTFTPNYRRELQKYTTKKRNCYCLRGGVKVANCFGPWDYLSLDVPADKVNQDHISSGNFLLNELRRSRCCRTMARGSGRSDEMSLGYLSRLGRGGAGERFRHFESVEEHIRYYRDNKPNSLHISDPEGSTKHHNTPVAGLPDQDVCARCLRPRVKPLTPTQQQSQQGPPTNGIHHCKCSHHLYRHPFPFPLRSMGKSIIPTCASIIMRLPSLELSNDSSYWVPVNAVLQKRLTVSTALYHSDDHNAASFSNSQVELPSLHTKKTPSDKTRQRSSYSPSKKKRTPLSHSVLHNSTNASGNEKRDVSCGETDLSRVTAANSYLTGSGRLLSGKLESSSSFHSTHPENLKDLVIGTPRSPYDTFVSNLAAMSHAKKSMQELYTRRTESASIKRQSGTAQQGKKSSQASGKEEENCAEPPHDSSRGLTLNKLDVMQERSEHEELLAESAIFCGPTIELKMEEMNGSTLNQPFQESLFTPSNVAITFTKPRTLFRMKSVQRKMRQHTYSDDKGAQSTSRDGGTALKRGGSRSLHNTKHRLALNKENNSGEEGVFGTRSHQASCAARSQERMRLQLKTAASSKRSESSNNGSSSSSGGRKVQVYLIKTARPLEDILPHLNSTEIYCQQGGGTVDLYGE